MFERTRQWFSKQSAKIALNLIIAWGMLKNWARQKFGRNSPPTDATSIPAQAVSVTPHGNTAVTALVTPPTPNNVDEEENTRQSDTGLSGAEVSVVLGVYLIWSALSFFCLAFVGTIPLWGKFLNFNPGAVMLGMLLAHIVLSCRIVPPTMLGVLDFFGNPKRNVDSGFVFVPFLIYHLHMEKRGRIEFDIPAPPEKIDKTGSDVPADGKVFPIRVTHASAKTATRVKGQVNLKGDPLHARITTEWIVAIWVQITDYRTFLQEIGDLATAKEQVHDVVEATLKEYGGRYTPAQIIPRLSEVCATLVERIRALMNGWGLAAREITITEMDLGKTINERLRDIPAAQFAKTATITAAEATGEKSRIEGIGSAKAREYYLEAEATGTKALAEVMKTDEGKVAAQLEMTRLALEKANFSILPSDSLYSVLTGLKNAADQAMKPKTNAA